MEEKGYIIAGIDGENCYGIEKLAMVTTAIGALDELISAGHEVWVYTDHHSDIGLLAECSHPVGVNPTPKLANWLEGRANASRLKWENGVGDK
jgi:phosphoserine phosphatase